VLVVLGKAREGAKEELFSMRKTAVNGTLQTKLVNTVRERRVAGTSVVGSLKAVTEQRQRRRECGLLDVCKREL
jgi:hypothetical protein